MRLDEVICGAPVDARARDVTGLAYDDRTVSPDTLFFWVPGSVHDVHDFAPPAVARGAAALVVERPLGSGIPELRVDSQRRFQQMLDQGDRACELEVSSHALELQRADAVPFTAAICTNLTQDHLDFHPTMEDYFTAEPRLFERPEPPGEAIAHVDDRYGACLAADLELPVTFALHSPARNRVTAVSTHLTESALTVETPDGRLELTSLLRGEFNVHNVQGALADARALEIPADTCPEAVATAAQVPGRLETVNDDQRFAVVVDYAHTPNLLQNVVRVAWTCLAAGNATSRGTSSR